MGNDVIDQMRQRLQNLKAAHGYLSSTADTTKAAETKAQIDFLQKEINKEHIRRGIPLPEEG